MNIIEKRYYLRDGKAVAEETTYIEVDKAATGKYIVEEDGKKYFLFAIANSANLDHIEKNKGSYVSQIAKGGMASLPLDKGVSLINEKQYAEHISLKASKKAEALSFGKKA